MVYTEKDINRAKDYAQELQQLTNADLKMIYNHESIVTNTVNNNNRTLVIMDLLTQEFGDDIINKGVIEIKF